MGGLFDPKNSPNRSRNIGDIKRWAAVALDIEEGVSLLVTELQCSEPGCPPIETVIALLRPGKRTEQFKIHRPIAEITQAEVTAALTHDPNGEHSHAHDD